MRYKYTLGIDPSGAFKEGKGTTGWCLLDNDKNEIAAIGTISAKDYDTDIDYWAAHLALIGAFVKLHGPIVVSMEDYILYKTQAAAQVNSRFETVQLIGIIKFYCSNNHIEYFMRPAVAVKARWSDAILVHKGYIKKVNAHYVMPNNTTHLLSDHERDAIRHAIHFKTFEKGKVE